MSLVHRRRPAFGQGHCFGGNLLIPSPAGEAVAPGAGIFDFSNAMDQGLLADSAMGLLAALAVVVGAQVVLHLLAVPARAAYGISVGLALATLWRARHWKSNGW